VTAHLEILGMPVDRLPHDEFIGRFLAQAEQGKAGYVCVANVHQCILAYDDPNFSEVIKGADYVISDSTVLQKFVGYKYHLPAIAVLRGDEMTLALCREAQVRGLQIALIGGKNDEVLERLVTALEQQVPGLAIAYAWSPPFRALSEAEEDNMLQHIRASGARILFLGLGCPKQERWMARYSSQLPLMMIGVGAAFDFISGEVKTSASWMHSAGLEWLHRLLSEPRRLWKRYFSTSPRFVWLFVTRDWKKG
jgi:N-acetylglucosaminyldiphosphoundecaprenol N-acetyl-beta-D-mannosaminyltransferase